MNRRLLTDTSFSIACVNWNYSYDTTLHSMHIWGRIDSYGTNGTFSIESLLVDLLNDAPVALNKLHGAYAGVIISNDGSVIIFNDHYDLESWYWCTSIDGRLVLSPQLETILLRSDCRHFVDENHLVLMLSPHYVLEEGNITGTKTAFSNISKTDFASIARFRDGKLLGIENYWNPEDYIDTSANELSQGEVYEKFRSLFLEVIQEQIRSSKGSFASELSGGVDSGCVTSALAALFEGSFMAVTVQSAPNDWLYEMSKIQDILDAYPSIEHVCMSFEQAPLVSPVENPTRLNMPETFRSYTSLLAEAGVHYLFSGEGADWYLEGSDYVWDECFRDWKIGPLLSSVRHMVKRGGISRTSSYLRKVALQQVLGTYASRVNLTGLDFPNLSNDARKYPKWVNPRVQILNEPVYEGMRDSLALKTSSTWESTVFTTLMFPPLHKWKGSAQTRMVFPFYDKRLMEFGFSIPNYWKFALGAETISYYGSCKQILRKGMVGVVPKSTLGCQKKATYSFPVNSRLRHNARQLFSRQDVLLQRMNLIDAEALVSSLESSSDDNDSWIDMAIAIELWLIKLEDRKLVQTRSR